MSVSVGETSASERRAGKPFQPVTQLDPEKVHEELNRILASPVFRNAKGQSRFLRFVIGEALDGRAHQLKEYSIGVEVFDRGEDFDPRTSNIVRIEANRLRTKLARYYQEEGHDRPLRIDLPKGGYAPVFHEPSETPVPGSERPEGEPDHATGSVTLIASPVSSGVLPPSANGNVSHAKARAILLLAHLPRVSGLFRIAIVGFLLIAAVAGAVVWRNWTTRTKSSNAPSIVVLPFVNLSGQADEFVSDGLTDELINSLGRVPGLQVVARTSAFQYKGKNLDVREIGHELNVGTVLEGTVRRDADRVRITVQLDDTGNGYRIWSRSFDREGNDVITMQREISQAIVDALGLELTVAGSSINATAGDRSEKIRKDPGNAEAYQSYLKGVYFSNRHTGESVQRAISYFEDATRKAPYYAPAYSGLARCYSMLPSFTNIPTTVVINKWRTAALKALELDPTLSEAHVYLGDIYMMQYDWASAERELTAGLRFDPNSSDGYRVYSLFLAKIGKLNDAIAQARKSVEVDPVSSYASNSLAKYLYQSRRFDEAVQQYRYSLQLDANEGITHQGLALVYLQKKMYPEAIAESDACRRIMNSDPFITGQLGYAYAMSGNKARAREILANLLGQSSPRGIISLGVANLYIGLNDNDRALEWLSRAVDQHDVNLFVQTDPIYDPLRSDPRFVALLHRMNLN